MLESLTSAIGADISQRTFDVCVIGAGAAGITLATELARGRLRVFLAEAGGLDQTEASQRLYQGNVIGDPYFDLSATRLRYFGGTTNHWGGLCRRMGANDFQPKPACPDTGWPITYDALAPYAARAENILEVSPQRPDRPLNSDVSELFWQFSPPVRFGPKYREAIASSENISALVNCNFLGFEFEGERVTSATFANYSDVQLAIRAKVFVLACGAIENSRILLLENRKFDDRLGNRAGLVGRYWTEHPQFWLGDFFLFDYTAFDAEPRTGPSGEAHVRIFAGPTRQFVEDSKILTCNLRLWPLYERTGAKKYLAEALCLAPEIANAVLERLGERLVCAGSIQGSWEQVPRYENRVALSTTPDLFGRSKCELHWRKHADDKLAPRTTALAMARYLAERDIGRIRLDSWVLNDNDEFPPPLRYGEPASNHHIGGTRMASSPSRGVVDPDGRVYGAANLYVGGSSVFPSSGHANPTFTIVQLALRLADHLVLQARRAQL